MRFLAKFFSTVRGSIKGLILPEELYRSIFTALGSGTVIGVLTLILQSVSDNVNTIVPNPAASSLVSMILTLVLDLLRRQNHGAAPTVVTTAPAATELVVPAVEPIVAPDVAVAQSSS